MIFWSLAFVAMLATHDARVPASPFQVDDGSLLVVWIDGNARPQRFFYANDLKRGRTNTNTRMSAGTYTITLGEPHDYTPSKIDVTIQEGRLASVTFTKIASQ